ncbi:MAG: hypothetical protein QF844_04960 [Acidimicrobiales bacterium]|nr:hypothetical protein [Acidimicrobiales bacterium]
MQVIRRALAAVSVAAAVAAALRINGVGGIAPRSGGWRPLAGPGLR